MTQYDYPPRVIFDITPLENAESSTLKLQLIGVTKQTNPIGFNVSLIPISRNVLVQRRGELLVVEVVLISYEKYYYRCGR